MYLKLMPRPIKVAGSSCEIQSSVRVRPLQETDDAAQLDDKLASFDDLNCRTREALGGQMRWTEPTETPTVHQRTGPVRCLAGRIAEGHGYNPRGDVLAERLDARGPRLVAKQTFKPFKAKRSCQRQTHRSWTCRSGA
jgi:hypothetical protein